MRRQPARHQRRITHWLILFILLLGLLPPSRGQAQSVLRSVTVGGSAGEVLPAMRLAYAWRRVDFWDGGRQGAGYQRPFLETVQNGYGGRVQFAYQTEPWSGRQLFQMVTSRTLNDGVSGWVATTNYHYHGSTRVFLSNRKRVS